MSPTPAKAFPVLSSSPHLNSNASVTGVTLNRQGEGMSSMSIFVLVQIAGISEGRLPEYLREELREDH